jgi:hypothetical protein
MPRDYDNVFDPSLEVDLSGLAVLPEERGLLARLMESGRQAGATEQPKGYSVGGTYIAASPLEHLAAALTSGLGQAKERRAVSDYRATLGNERSARANAMRRYGLLATSEDESGAGPYAGSVPELVR